MDQKNNKNKTYFIYFYIFNIIYDSEDSNCKYYNKYDVKLIQQFKIYEIIINKVKNIDQKMRRNIFLTINPNIRQTYGLKNSTAVCLVKGKYFESWSSRQIRISLEDNTLQLISLPSQKVKSFVLENITYTKDQSQDCIRLKVSENKIYEIKNSQQLQQLLIDIDIYKHFKHLGESGQEALTPKPIKSNYSSYFLEPQNSKPLSQGHQSTSSEPRKRSLSGYKRESSYYKNKDWEKDKNGGLVLVNKQKKGMIPQVIGYAAKKLLKVDPFLQQLYPHFHLSHKALYKAIVNAQGLLQSFYKMMKAFNTVILTMSIMFNDIQKGFSPELGQTFQGQIAGNPVYAQQICRKPSLTSFLLVGQQYRIYGILELNLNLGLNQAVGVFNGQVSLQFKDGGLIKGSMPKGTMSGVVFGETKFGPSGAVYSYDTTNQIISSYQVIKKDLMKGYIGKLKQNASEKFYTFLDSKNTNNFKALQQKDFQSILSKIQVVWTDHITYDGIEYFNYNDRDTLPITMTQDLNNLEDKQTLLPSDSNFRKDIQLRRVQNMQDSQRQNDFIENQQQRYARLRQAYQKRY